MSSDRLSFNQSADNEDDGARWEAYQALLRRTAPASPEEAEASPELEDGFAEVDDRLAEPAFDQDQHDMVEAELAAEDDPRDHPVLSEIDESEPLRFEPLQDDPAMADDDAEAGLGAWDRPPPERPAGVRLGRNARLVGATLALTAGIILAASLLQPQPAQRDTPPASGAARVSGEARRRGGGRRSGARRTAGAGRPCLPALPARSGPKEPRPAATVLGLESGRRALADRLSANRAVVQRGRAP
jgi:hypothetical protein